MITSTSVSFTLSPNQFQSLRKVLSTPPVTNLNYAYSDALLRQLEEARLVDSEANAFRDAALDTNDPVAAMHSIFSMVGHMTSTAMSDSAPTADSDVTLDLDADLAREISTTLAQRYGILLTLSSEQQDDTLTTAVKIVARALGDAFPEVLDRLVLGYVSGHGDPGDFSQVEAMAAPKTMDETLAVATLGIANEADGDICGYYIFDNAALNALDASGTDPFDFVNSSDPKAPRSISTLSEALREMADRGLTLEGDFGICAY